MNILLSYPRSGNHGTRFIIEFLSKRPTLGCRSNKKDKPIFQNIFPDENPLEIDTEKPIIEKVHFYNHIKEIDKLILIVRNWKEAILRHKTYNEKQLKKFFDNIKFFDEFKGEKLLIFYKDLLFDPSTVAKKLYDFLGLQNEERLNEFINNIEYYSSISRKGENRAGGGSSSGMDTSFHRKRKGKVDFKDKFIEKNYGYLIKKYNLDYEK